eukprot:GCRY01003243.1.p1 GENE.GCRY01003243.1~~GCRY01003243.1.p1  ORF type:complete len:385 (+),score=79.03 GCRY01003243.1:151-1305(+)
MSVIKKGATSSNNSEDDLDLEAFKTSVQVGKAEKDLLTFKDTKDKTIAVMDDSFNFHSLKSGQKKLIGRVDKKTGQIYNAKDKSLGKVTFNDGFVESNRSGLIATVNRSGELLDVLGRKQIEIRENALRNGKGQVVARVLGLGRKPPLLPYVLISVYVVFFNPLHTIVVKNYLPTMTAKLQKNQNDYCLYYERDCRPTDVKVIDDQHKKLFSLYNVVYNNLMSNKTSLEPLQQVVKALTDYIQVHFETEQTLLRFIEYPQVEGHMKFHSGFVEKINNIKVELASVQSGDTTVPRYSLRLRTSFGHSLNSSAIEPRKNLQAPSSMDAVQQQAEETLYESTFFDIVLFLRSWLQEHLSECDQGWAQYIKKNNIDIAKWEEEHSSDS